MSNPYHVAFLTPTLDRLGGARVATAVASGLAAIGYQVDMLVFGDGEPVEMIEGVRIIRPAKSPTVAALSRMLPTVLGVHYLNSLTERIPSVVRYLSNEQPSALICFGASSVALLARRLSGVRCRTVIAAGAMVSYLAKGNSKFRSRAKQWFLAYFLRAADCVVACSSGLSDELRQLGVRPTRLRVIHNPVIGPDFHQRAEKPLAHPWFDSADIPVILAAGEFLPVKDFETLVRALAIVAAVRPARLMILGDGIERARLQAVVAELGISDLVAMPGYQSNPYNFMRRASVFVSSSVSEGFGNVVAEALAAGTPVVATRCAGPAEILADGRFGRLVPPRDPAALAAGILATLQNKIDRAELRNRAREFTLERVLPSYMDALGLPPLCPHAQPLAQAK